MFEVDLGKIKFKWRGAYDATVGYTVDDVVRYNNNNYVCTADNGNTLPDVAPSVGTPFWDLMTQGVEAPVGTPADKDVIVYDGTNSQQVYQRPTGVVAIHEHTFDKLGRWASGGNLTANVWTSSLQVFDDSNTWINADTVMQDAVDNNSNAHVYPWAVFSPNYDDSFHKVEMTYFIGTSDVSGQVHFRVYRYCVEDATSTRAIAVNPWAVNATADDTDFGYYSYTNHAATYQYANHPVKLNFVDKTPLDPSKHYLYYLEIRANAAKSAAINHNPAYTGLAYGTINVSNTIITEFRNPS
jgi:hypothetical protein